jgi:hypothetical protein
MGSTPTPRETEVIESLLTSEDAAFNHKQVGTAFWEFFQYLSATIADSRPTRFKYWINRFIRGS